MSNPDVTPDEPQRDVAVEPGADDAGSVPAAPTPQPPEPSGLLAAQPDVAASDAAAGDAGAPATDALDAGAPVATTPDAEGIGIEGIDADAPDADAPDADGIGAGGTDAGRLEAGSDAAPAEPLAEAARERDAYLDALRRERAEFENFRRRSARERAEALDRGAERLVVQLLGVLDNFGYVLDAAKDSSDESLATGTRMVHSELLTVLERAGLQRVPGVGEPFDPTHHEAVMQVEAPEPVEHPVVAEVLRPGYRFKDRVLRPASVSVAQ